MLYLNIKKKISIFERKVVYLKDVADIYVGNKVGNKVENKNDFKFSNLIVFKIKDDVKKIHLLSVIDIIKVIKIHFPEIDIINLGEIDILIEYNPKFKNENKFINFLKASFICLILFSGGMTAIMAFHTDADMPLIIKGYYEIFFGEKEENPLILYIPYTIGILFGIIVFFNHFSKFKLTNDPTPIEVQMTTYENETTINIVDTLAKNLEGDSDDGP